MPEELLLILDSLCAVCFLGVTSYPLSYARLNERPTLLFMRL